ncbi:MAG TPA: flavodoxin family protein, partial [Nitrospirae bacterium]|nr:flavodoxin family protein [Nitrospirota bacterium]
NTYLLFKEAVRGIEESGSEVRLFDLNCMDIQPCQDCGGCEETGECVVRDDMDVVYDAIRTADRIMLASPIFFFALSAQAKIMIDRCQSFWCEKYLLKKPVQAGPSGRKGLLLLVGGMKKDIGIQCAGSSATAFFRTISVPEHQTLSFPGIDSKGEILKHPTALKDAYEAGRKLAAF